MSWTALRLQMNRCIVDEQRCLACNIGTISLNVQTVHSRSRLRLRRRELVVVGTYQELCRHKKGFILVRFPCTIEVCQRLRRSNVRLGISYRVPSSLQLQAIDVEAAAGDRAADDPR